MLRVTDSLYIKKNETVSYAAIVQNDLSGVLMDGFTIVLKLSEVKDVVKVGHIAQSFATLLPKLRTIASSVGLVRITDTLYVKSYSAIRMIHNVDGYLRIRYGEDTLYGWPTWVSNEDCDSIIKEIVASNSENINNINNVIH